MQYCAVVSRWADVVTKDCIYEVKDALNQEVLYKAIGQLFLYRTCLNPKAKLCIVYNSSNVKTMHDYVESLGIKLLQEGTYNECHN